MAEHQKWRMTRRWSSLALDSALKPGMQGLTLKSERITIMAETFSAKAAADLSAVQYL